MKINFDQAVRIFEQLPTSSQFATLHPYFVQTDSLREKAAEPIFFGTKEGNCIFYHSVLKVPIPGTKYFDLQSVYGYGGPVIVGDDENFVKRCIDAYQTWCLEEKAVAEFIRFHPMLENMKGYYGAVFKERSTVYMDLSRQDKPPYRTLTRRRLRQAEKLGVRCVQYTKPEEFQNVFVPMYEELMQFWKANREYFFPLSYYEQLIKWDKAWLLACEDSSGETLAAGIFLHCGEHVEYHLGASTPNGKNVGAMYALIDYAAHLGKSSGCTILFLGGGTTDEPDNSLLFFKTGFSPEIRSFYLGKTVHLTQVYEQWREEWVREKGRNPDKILFYRF